MQRTLITPDLDSALAVWKDLPTGWTLVTAAGERLEADGTIIGGQATHASLLLRTSEIGELQIVLKDQERRLKHLSELTEFLTKRADDLDSQKEQASKHMLRLEAQVRTSRDEIKRLRDQIVRLEDHHGSLLGEIMELDRALEEGAQEANLREEKTRELAAQIGELKEQVEEWDKKIAKLTERRREVHEGITSARLQRLEREKDVERWRSEIERGTRRIAELENTIQKNSELITEQEERAVQVEASIAEQKELLVKYREEQSAVHQELEKGENEAAEVKAKVRTIEDEEDRLHSRVENVDGQRSEVDQERIRLSVDLEYWERRMNELFGEERPENIDDERGDEEIAEEITLLRGRLERIGVVNELAIEEYEEVKVRLEALLEQREDLYKARSDLLHTIRELHNTTVGLFQKTFDEVQENFKASVRRMFNGGRAELRLEEGVDPMQAGIEIEVQPPGKKLISISLMSGGEKALVAIALMFAVYQTKPSPFCFLDEIDAPLDDTNIGRFTTMLEAFLSTSQFIIISHNKKTMEIADTLYGVTMQEEGISTLMSMQFESRDGRKEAIEKRAMFLRRRIEEEGEDRRMIDLDQLGRDEPDELDVDESPVPALAGRGAAAVSDARNEIQDLESVEANAET